MCDRGPAVPDETLPGDDELGGLGVAHLARMWARAASAREGRSLSASTEHDTECDRILLNGLGLGLEPTLVQMWQSSSALEDFERWVLAEKGGELDPAHIRRVNALILGERYDQATVDCLAAIDALPPVLDENDLRSWLESGYVVVRDAIDGDVCRAAERAVWEHLAASPDEPASWYPSRLNGIMVQLFQHPALEAVRRSPRIHKAFAQLWDTADLLVTTDRCGFNPPERNEWRFPGPHLHLDVALEPPVPFGTQGIVYLTSISPDQGAFLCVPGFHREIDEWLGDALRPQDRDAQIKALDALPIAGRAGDLVIWHQALPHGASANRAAFPRIAQYVAMAPPFPSPNTRQSDGAQSE